MPNKHNALGRHHIPKMKFWVKNWAEYDAGLRRRGSLTLWVTAEVLDGWNAARRTPPGGQSVYSELAIETGMMLRVAFHLALRQTEGLMASMFGLLGVPLSTPDHSTLSRRARTMESISKGCVLPDGPIHLLIDRTGLKVFGAGEWLQEKHGAKARRTWKKLHLAVDADTGMIMASTLTGNDVGEGSSAFARSMQQRRPAVGAKAPQSRGCDHNSRLTAASPSIPAGQRAAGVTRRQTRPIRASTNFGRSNPKSLVRFIESQLISRIRQNPGGPLSQPVAAGAPYRFLKLSLIISSLIASRP
jgi:hypothetical protein